MFHASKRVFPHLQTRKSYSPMASSHLSNKTPLYDVTFWQRKTVNFIWTISLSKFPILNTWSVSVTSPYGDIFRNYMKQLSLYVLFKLFVPKTYLFLHWTCCDHSALHWNSHSHLRCHFHCGFHYCYCCCCYCHFQKILYINEI